MKKYTIRILLVLIFSMFSFAQTFIPVTKDNEVEDRNLVQIKAKTPETKEEIFILSTTTLGQK